MRGFPKSSIFLLFFLQVLLGCAKHPVYESTPLEQQRFQRVLDLFEKGDIKRCVSEDYTFINTSSESANVEQELAQYRCQQIGIKNI